MNVNDYLLNQEGLDFNAIFEDWRELLPSSFTVWLINRFGDIFMELEDGSVSILDVGIGQIRTLAASKDEFCRLIDQDRNAFDWLMISLVDQLVRAGKTLAKDQCYSFKNKPPILGGEYSLENTEVCNVYVHYSLLGQIATKAKDLPHGTKIHDITIKRGA